MKINKTFCDKCGKEIDTEKVIYFDLENNKKKYQFCEECGEKIVKWMEERESKTNLTNPSA